MKALWCLCLCVLVCWMGGTASGEALAQDEAFVDSGDYYVVNNDIVPLVRYRHKVAAKLKSGHSEKALNGASFEEKARQYGYVTDSLYGKALFDSRNILVFQGAGDLFGPESKGTGASAALFDSEDVDYVRPVYYNRKNQFQIIAADELLVQFARGCNDGEMASVMDRYGLKDRVPVIAESFVFKVTMTDPSSEDPFRLANRLAEEDRVVWAEPNFYSDTRHCYLNDRYFDDQWYLYGFVRNTEGYYQLGINAESAWSFQKGDPDVVIAVVDSGIDRSHPDLDIYVNPGESGGGRESNGVDDDHNGFVDDYSGWDFIAGSNNADPDEANINAHGTLCAGVAAAKGNNSLGIAGIAYGCKVLPVKVDNDQYISNSIEAYARGIRYAADMADVISCSWSHQESNTIIAAIDYAVTSGRGGKGCPVFVSSGNRAARFWNPVFSPQVSEGYHQLEWVFVKDDTWPENDFSGTAWISGIIYPDATVDYFDYVDIPLLPLEFSTYGDALWYSSREPGLYLNPPYMTLRSGAIGKDETSSLILDHYTDVGGTNYVPFVWLETGPGSWLDLYYDGEIYSRYYGEGLNFPSSYTKTIAVGASNIYGNPAYYSQYGEGLDFLAPGGDIVHAMYTTDVTGTAGYSEDDYFDRFQGTSASTAIAAGLAALIISKNPRLKWTQIREIMRESCRAVGPDPYGTDNKNIYCGYGLLDAEQALVLTPGIEAGASDDDGSGGSRGCFIGSVHQNF